MTSNLNQLDYILNIEQFQKIQDDIAKATGMAVIAIDYTGKPITNHSCCTDFCKKVRSNKELAKLCEKCDSRGGLEAARDEGAYIYLCHFGIVDIAIPIVFDGQYLGAIMAGQVLVNIAEAGELEKIVSKKYQLNLENHPELAKEYLKLNTMPLDKIQSIANMINRLINYIVGEAALKTRLYGDDTETESNSGHKLTLLKPALSYIEEHYKDKIYLEKMAYLCNISPGYFSKIFKIETGENFSNYVNIVKLNEARELLEKTNDPIANIALDLGFEDCGYFIKVFKKHVGETPANYRNSKIMHFRQD